jgi:hypothetical protein
VRYVVEVWRTEDDRVEGCVASEGSTQMEPFSGWIGLFGLLEPPPLEVIKGETNTWHTTTNSGR